MEMIRAGPVGGTGSKTDTHWDEKGKAMISHIFVSFNSSQITSIQFGYIENGALVMSSKYGGDFKGQSFRVVKLKHNEYVTGLSGCAGISSLLSECGGINSLTFYTNLGKHGPICEPVTKYVVNTKREIDLAICDRREFGGIFGSCNKYNLISIGIYVNPIPSSNTAVKRENV